MLNATRITRFYSCLFVIASHAGFMLIFKQKRRNVEILKMNISP